MVGIGSRRSVAREICTGGAKLPPATQRVLEVIRSGERVALVSPNGAEMVVAVLSFISYVAFVPISQSSTQGEFADALRDCEATCVVLLDSQGSETETNLLTAARGLELSVIEAMPDADDSCGIFSLNRLLHLSSREQHKRRLKSTGVLLSECLGVRASTVAPLKRTDCALVLQTSGTTGKKKNVPHTLEDLVMGGVLLGASCRLTPADVVVNAMPLFHVGGIMRCVLSSVLSGSTVVAMGFVDPDAFWRNVKRYRATWYYAGPTIHAAYLKAHDPASDEASTLRLVCNASGPLSHELASQMRERYSATGVRCVIAPSYGMTECMPISAPPEDYDLTQPGSSGTQLGPTIAIHDEAGKSLPAGEVGHIVLQGRPTMHGYEKASGGNGFVDGWFDTGDIGYLNEVRPTRSACARMVFFKLRTPLPAPRPHVTTAHSPHRARVSGRAATCT